MSTITTNGRGSAGRLMAGAALVSAVVLAVVASVTNAAPPRAATKKPVSGVVTIAVQPIAVTSHSEVTIGDVASVEGGEPALRDRIMRLDLSDAPDLLKPTKVTRDLITHRIRIAGIDAKKYRLQGAETVLVSSQGYRVPEQEIINVAKQYLRARLPWKPDDVTIESTRSIRGPIQVPGSKEDVRIEVSLRGSRLGLGNIPVDVSVFSKGVKQTDVALAFDVHLSQNIAVAYRQIERGRTITAEDVFYEKRVIDKISGYLLESESPIGRKAKRTIQPLQPVTKADLDAADAEGEFVIRQRDAVRLVAKAGNLTITTTGEALQDGRTGQMIRVRNVDSKTVVSGRVVNRNEVHVLY